MTQESFIDTLCTQLCTTKFKKLLLLHQKRIPSIIIFNHFFKTYVLLLKPN